MSVPFAVRSMLAAIALAGVAAPALAGSVPERGVAGVARVAIDPDARLVEFGGRTFVRVTGRGAIDGGLLRVNGRLVSATGRNAWRADIALDDVRAWSQPFARTLAIEVDDVRSASAAASVRLPIGLLGHNTELASIEVTRH